MLVDLDPPTAAALPLLRLAAPATPLLDLAGLAPRLPLLVVRGGTVIIPVGWCEECGEQTTLKIRTRRWGVRWLGRWRWLCPAHAAQAVAE